jgi:hypothetical protein
MKPLNMTDDQLEGELANMPAAYAAEENGHIEDVLSECERRGWNVVSYRERFQLTPDERDAHIEAADEDMEAEAAR